MTARQVRELMAYLEVTGVELARRLGVNRATVGKWRLGAGLPASSRRQVSRQSAMQLYQVAQVIAREKGKDVGAVGQYFSASITEQGQGGRGRRGKRR